VDEDEYANLVSKRRQDDFVEDDGQKIFLSHENEPHLFYSVVR
jgi:hypothetical protein